MCAIPRLLTMDPAPFQSPRGKLNVHSWAWNCEVESPPVHPLPSRKFPPVTLTEDNRNVLFHWGWSNGTAAVRGDEPFTCGHNYFWEIMIFTAPYGTDVMIGVGTENVGLFLKEVYSSLLGLDNESWGLSYTGKLHHNGSVVMDCRTGFNIGDVVGVHLDMWFGSLTFFVNGVELGTVNDLSLKKQSLYPMMSSTSASTCMKLIYSYSTNNLLQKMCLQRLKNNKHMMSVISTIPGLYREHEKIFLDTTDVKVVTDKTAPEHKSLFLVEESDEDEYVNGISVKLSVFRPKKCRRVNQKVLKIKCIENVNCVKCGVDSQTRMTRLAASRQCENCSNEIDIYADI